MLDARLCGVQVERPVLDVAEDATGRLEKGLLHAVARLRRRLDEHEAVLVGELLRLLVGDVTLRLQVALVADEEDDGVRVRQVAGVRQPGAQVVVRGASPEKTNKKYDMSDMLRASKQISALAYVIS